MGSIGLILLSRSHTREVRSVYLDLSQSEVPSPNLRSKYSSQKLFKVYGFRRRDRVGFSKVFVFCHALTLVALIMGTQGARQGGEL